MCIAAPGKMKCCNENFMDLACRKAVALRAINSTMQGIPVVGNWIMDYRCPNFKLDKSQYPDDFWALVDEMVDVLLNGPIKGEGDAE